jgi:hypothetical protein
MNWFYFVRDGLNFHFFWEYGCDIDSGEDANKGVGPWLPTVCENNYKKFRTLLRLCVKIWAIPLVTLDGLITQFALNPKAQMAYYMNPILRELTLNNGAL